GVNTVGLAALDAKAKAAYKQRLSDLRAELDEAAAFKDLGRTARLQAEQTFLTEQLSAAVGLGGRDRLAGANAERARNAVTKRIRGVVRKIRPEHPTLAHHLDTCIRTGVFCVYVPDPARTVGWEFPTSPPTTP